jgi:YVTN family beta-propeller protein
MKHFISFVVLSFLSFVANAQNAKDIHLLNTFHIASEGKWDYLAVEPNSNKLFVSHGNQVNILNKTTGDSLGIIPNTTGVHGIAFITALQKGYTSNGKANNVTVFDLKTNAVLSQIATGQNPDAIFYEPFSKTIITSNGKSNDISVIDPTTNTVIKTIKVGGKPETAVSNGVGKIYINIEDKNEIVVVDAASFEVINHWSLGKNEGPSGLEIDNKTNRLFCACSDSKTLVVVDAKEGNIVSTLPIGAGCDGVAFDNKTQLIYTSNGQGTMSVLKEKSKDEFETVATIPTKKSARTIAIDEETHKVYLPAADMELPNSGGKPKMIAGTFQVLVFGMK